MPEMPELEEESEPPERYNREWMVHVVRKNGITYRVMWRQPLRSDEEFKLWLANCKYEAIKRLNINHLK